MFGVPQIWGTLKAGGKGQKPEKIQNKNAKVTEGRCKRSIKRKISEQKSEVAHKEER